MSRSTIMPSICYFRRRHLMILQFHILLIVLLFPGRECTMPEASQEGLLHSFKSYSDIAMFHYTVPKEVLRATWQFAAFMDGQGCPERKVHIYLQWGSYPVISVNNDTFPKDMYPMRNQTITISAVTTFEPKTTAVVPIYGPEAGDWFVGAYLSYWDEKVQQQGLGHKCHYSIGSVAIWTQANSIENVPIGYTHNLRTKETTSYYKIYIPSGTWNFRVDIWGCNFTVQKPHDVQELCIKSLALKGRSLPIFNHSELAETVNLTMQDSYRFRESSPYEDSYYYLMIVSDSVIELNVKVTISECPIRITEKSFVRQYLDAPSFSKALAQLHMKDLTKHRLHHTESRNNESFYGEVYLMKNQFHESDETFDDPCVPRYQLARIKHSQTFSGVYLLQGREWLTSWVMLTDVHPVVTQFNILPLVDIGGTLDISAHLEMDKVVIKQLVKVLICVRRGRVPDRVKSNIVCKNPEMSMNLSSSDKRDGNILIPYPQPDTWYVTLDATCYFNGNPVKCEMEEILVSLDIRTRQCVFPGNYPCGHHGICQEIHRDILYYTACKCFEGYKGWGCTDATNANPESSLLVTTLILTLSNGFFIPAIYLAVKRGLYTEGLVYLATMLFSSLYHACDQHVMTYCVAKYEVLQYSDFFSSILAFWVTLVAMAEIPIRFVSLCHMFGVFIIAFGVESNKTGLASILVPLGMGIMIPMGAYAYRCFQLKKWKKPDQVSKLLTGLTLAIIGLLLFSLIETEANYQYVHSAWHMIIAISLVFLLPPSRLEQVGSSGSSFSDDSELLDYKDPPGSPIFTVTSGQENLVIASN
ncbi:post-GPI attachment to proteins factor 6-like isoform X1 [Ceratina calcarata]|uniref:Post-GPI attachment to proteins factor 6-like isoform X1 n=1 Tax=Ceratina calcarata TaxID=156304 RepID=A0AAJ7S022_9HYME|nr:post-GPI attachment to proteins factor 6-like isoform X1 [Ceratina calcarata]XP_026668907.1 post-GPI attachment to proteins factor 6-like isoform X1 [Ceratina calcarata]XP_026668908.1 post-GPI attachment to proteins factor 6-like isoform X1 [Ceratina calcarata]